MKNIVKGSFLSGKEDIKLKAIETGLRRAEKTLQQIKLEKNSKNIRRIVRQKRIASQKEFLSTSHHFLDADWTPNQRAKAIKSMRGYKFAKRTYTTKKQRKILVEWMKNIKSEIDFFKNQLLIYTHEKQ